MSFLESGYVTVPIPVAPPDTIIPVAPPDTIMPVAPPTVWVDPIPPTIQPAPDMSTQPVAAPATGVTGGGVGIITNPVAATNIAPLGWGGALLLLAHFI